jgi:hypothetical protein
MNFLLTGIAMNRNLNLPQGWFGMILADRVKKIIGTNKLKGIKKSNFLMSLLFVSDKKTFFSTV